MKIQVMSDLHLEVADMEIKNKNGADVLVLAGDILVGDKLLKQNSQKGEVFRNFLVKARQEYNNVVYVAGNHEFYSGGKFFGTLRDLETFCSDNNIYFLENKIVEINGVHFLGSTLWTDMNRYDPLTMLDAPNRMNDYKAIVLDYGGYRHVSAHDTCTRHKKSVDFIKETLEGLKDKTCVVVTHHAPSFQSVDPKYRNERVMNGYYYSDLDYLMWDNPQVVLWSHGHSHCFMDYHINQTRVVCNPRGYRGYYEETGWNPNLIVEVKDEQNLQRQAPEVQGSLSL